MKSNDYITIFRLNSRKLINAFIWDFGDLGKMNRVFEKVNIPDRPIDYVSTFKLKNALLINKFIEDFCVHSEMQDAVTVAKRVELEEELGIDIFRQAHEAEKLERTKRRLQRKFDRRLN